VTTLSNEHFVFFSHQNEMLKYTPHHRYFAISPPLNSSICSFAFSTSVIESPPLFSPNKTHLPLAVFFGVSLLSSYSFWGGAEQRSETEPQYGPYRHRLHCSAGQPGDSLIPWLAGRYNKGVVVGKVNLSLACPKIQPTLFGLGRMAFFFLVDVNPTPISSVFNRHEKFTDAFFQSFGNLSVFPMNEY